MRFLRTRLVELWFRQTARAVVAAAVGMESTMRTGLVSATRLRPSLLMNGAAAGLGVAGVAPLAAVLAPDHASAIMLGAICMSIADAPTSLIEKLKRIALAWVLSSLALLAAASADGFTLLESSVVMAAGFCAAMVTAYGRNAIAISVAILLALALAASADVGGASAPIAALWFAIGGFFYAGFAVVLTLLMARRTKLMLLKETLQGLADYLRMQKLALDEGVAPRRVYAMLIESQTVMAERLQAARNVVLVGTSSPGARQIAAELVIAIDILEAALSEQADLDTLLEMGGEGDETLKALRALLLVAAIDLDRLARAVGGSSRRDVAAIGDRHALLAKIKAPGNADPGRNSVLRATANKIETLFAQIERLAGAQAQTQMADSVIGALDFDPFVQRSVFDLRSLVRELNLRSPVARFAIRLSLAMFCGSLISSFLPYRAHGAWILLTIALVMRANYSVTRQRRDERLLGNIIGCILAAIALTLAPARLVPVLVFFAVGTAHAFAIQSYLVASVASCVMALLQIHMAEPSAGVFFFMRIADTAIGGLIAYAFSFFLPYWEYQTIGKLAPDLLNAERQCAHQALALNCSDQAYRLARRRLFEAIAALSTAVSRMLEEPSSARYDPRALSEFLATAYVFAAELASVQVFVRSRADRNNPGLATAIELTRRSVDDKLARASAAGRPANADLREAEASPADARLEPLVEGADLFTRRLRRAIVVADRARALAIEVMQNSPGVGGASSLPAPPAKDVAAGS